MNFEPPLIKGILVKRYKRFLADIILEDDSQVTAHTPNTGSMQGCSESGSNVWLRNTQNPKRRYIYAWEMIEAKPNVLVGINTLLSNSLVAEAIENGTISELQGYAQIKPEVKYGAENSRIDLLLSEHASKPDCFVEVKNVTLERDGIAYFPDAVSKRGSKHLRELQLMVSEGKRAVIFYCVQRNDVNEFRPADDIDPEYGQLLRESVKLGVEAYAYTVEISPEKILINEPIAIVCT